MFVISYLAKFVVEYFAKSLAHRLNFQHYFDV